MPIISLVAGVDGQLEARGAVLDKDGELLVNHSSGRLNREVQATLLSVHPGPTPNGGNQKSAALATFVTDTEDGTKDSGLSGTGAPASDRRGRFRFTSGSAHNKMTEHQHTSASLRKKTKCDI